MKNLLIFATTLFFAGCLGISPDISDNLQNCTDDITLDCIKDFDYTQGYFGQDLALKIDPICNSLNADEKEKITAKHRYFGFNCNQADYVLHSK